MNTDFEKRSKSSAGQPSGLKFHTNGHWTIQEATIEHLHQLVSLEELCFSVPWSPKSFEAELHGNQFSHVLIIPHPEYGQKIQVIGYICVWVVFEEIRFLNVAVHPDFRRQGIARHLISEALRLGKEAGCCRGMLEVRATNSPAKNLYESFHFTPYARRKSYYTNPIEDAILMILEPLNPLDNERREKGDQLFGSQTTIHKISE